MTKVVECDNKLYRVSSLVDRPVVKIIGRCAMTDDFHLHEPCYEVKNDENPKKQA